MATYNSRPHTVGESSLSLRNLKKLAANNGQLPTINEPPQSEYSDKT